MKRDFDLVRKLLIYFEERESSEWMIDPPAVEGVSAAVVSYHLRLLYEAGFLMGEPIYRERLGHTPSAVGTGIYTEYLLRVNAAELTWDGQEFLSKIKNEGTWNGSIPKKG